MFRDFTRGVIRENPVFVTLLGLCPALAVTTHVVNALGLGLAVIVVLVSSNATVSLLRDIVPRRMHYPVFLAVTAGFVTIVDLVMQAYLSGLSERLGVFVPLIAVNCAVLARSDTLARSASPGRAVLDGLGIGLGFLLSLVLIALVREVVGAGTVTLFAVGSFSGVLTVPVLSERPISVMIFAPGALFAVGYLRALFGLPAGARERRHTAATEDSQ